MGSRRVMTIGPEAVGAAIETFQLQGLRSMRSVRIWPRQAAKHAVEIRSRRQPVTDEVLATVFFDPGSAGGMVPVQLPWWGEDARISVLRSVAGDATFEAELEFSEDLLSVASPALVWVERFTLGAGEGRSHPFTFASVAPWTVLGIMVEASDTAVFRYRAQVEGVDLGFFTLFTLAAGVPQRTATVREAQHVELNVLNTGAAGNTVSVLVRGMSGL